MEKHIEARLISFARRIFAKYQSQLEPKYASQLEEAICICETYQQGVGDWGDMYEVILGDGGISEYSEGVGDFTEKQRTMWVLETCILICCCYLGCQKEQDYTPEDMELRGENILAFLEFCEELPDSLPDCAYIWEYWNRNLCY